MQDDGCSGTTAAFWTIRAEEATQASELFHLTGSNAEDIDVVMTADEVDIEGQEMTTSATP
jgi:hypothetical protein